MHKENTQFLLLRHFQTSGVSWAYTTLPWVSKKNTNHRHISLTETGLCISITLKNTFTYFLFKISKHLQQNQRPKFEFWKNCAFPSRYLYSETFNSSNSDMMWCLWYCFFFLLSDIVCCFCFFFIFFLDVFLIINALLLLVYNF